jgi:hypothetical protein
MVFFPFFFYYITNLGIRRGEEFQALQRFPGDLAHGGFF